MKLDIFRATAFLGGPMKLDVNNIDRRCYSLNLTFIGYASCPNCHLMHKGFNNYQYHVGGFLIVTMV